MLALRASRCRDATRAAGVDPVTERAFSFRLGAVQP